MSDDREFLRATTEWLEAGSDRTPPKAVNAVLLAVRTTRQDRVLPIPWRPIDMQTVARAMVAAAAVVVVSLAWINFGPSGNSVGGAPTPTPTPRPFAATQWGPLDPGTRYVTTDPFPIRVTFEVPSGYMGNIGGPYAAYIAHANASDIVWFHIFDMVYADPCHFDQGLIRPTLGPSADDLANALASLPGLNATTPTKTTFGGLPATTLTLTAPSSISACTGGVFRVWELPQGATNDMVAGQRERVWILDVDGKRLTVAAIELPGETQSGLAEIQQVLDSILIETSTN